MLYLLPNICYQKILVFLFKNVVAIFFLLLYFDFSFSKKITLILLLNLLKRNSTWTTCKSCSKRLKNVKFLLVSQNGKVLEGINSNKESLTVTGRVARKRDKNCISWSSSFIFLLVLSNNYNLFSSHQDFHGILTINPVAGGL